MLLKYWELLLINDAQILSSSYAHEFTLFCYVNSHFLSLFSLFYPDCLLLDLTLFYLYLVTIMIIYK